jgi:hypothetical protein
MNRYRNQICFLLVVLALAACGSPPTPTPDLVATQVAVEEAAQATLTAKAPTATLEPTDTSTPTPTLTPTETSTPTTTPLPTALPWETWASDELGVSLIYPTTCKADPIQGGQRFVDTGKWLMIVEMQERKDHPGDWDLMLRPGRIQVNTLIDEMATALDMSLDQDFVLISEDAIIERAGLEGWNTRYRKRNYLGAIEALILKSDKREWVFAFVEWGSKYKSWTDRAKASITVVP